ncbi:MAG TPA: helix-turn-helix domain-containing protein [Pseudonocardiaceae bacterium]|nr:helix-turn-helix domain-containing protein [Pseudonocardiaceae bacterium]
MSDDVKGLREARVAATEERILTGARNLFVRKGYHATTLTEVADEAGVGHRTVYLRFGTKAALLKRVTDIAVAGDAGPSDVAHRDWFHTALSAPTLDERIDALTSGTTELMRRAGDLFEAVQQAQPAEPLLADAFQAGREATRHNLHTFIDRAVTDGLVDRHAVDVAWLRETVTLVCHADTYILLRRTTHWEIRDYHTWLTTTLHRLLP